MDKSRLVSIKEPWAMSEYIYGNWDLVLWNIVLFGLFVFTIPFKKKLQRYSASAYLAFIVALFTEMYGLPLTIYILAWLFGYQNPLTHSAGHLLLGMTGCMFGSMMMSIGIILIILGWSRIRMGKGALVTDGIYRYIRHPQYLGFLLLVSGMLVQWTTIPTALMWPILTVLYYRLAREEEREMEERFGKEYLEYKRKVPMFIPTLPILRRNKKLSVYQR